MRDWDRPQPPTMRSRRLGVIAALLAGAATASGCGTQVDGDGGAAPDGTLTGLQACESTDGPVAAFWGSADREGELNVVDIWTATAAGQVEQLTDDGRSRDPSMSDDAQRLYFTRSNGGLLADAAAPGTELWVMDLPNREESMIFDAGERSPGISSVEESPNGTAVAFAANLLEPPRPQTRVYVMNLENPAELLEFPLQPAKDEYPFQYQTDPTWSPDGSQLAYVLVESNNSGGMQSSLRVLDVASGEDTLLYQPEGGRSRLLNPYWTADGTTLVMAAKLDGRQDQFAALAVDTGSGVVTTLVEDGVESIVADASPDGTAIASIELMPADDTSSLRRPILTTWTRAGASTQELPVELTLAAQLTIADCALTAGS